MTTTNSPQPRTDHSHAIVIGASMAGLLAAHVLSDYFERVTVIERDRLPEGEQARKGVPQGQHIHILLNKGASILEDLFPDLFPALEKDGAIAVDRVANTRWYHFGVWKAQFESHLKGYMQSRPFLEWHVRDQLRQRSNISFIEGCEVAQLRATADQSRITGVHLRYHTPERGEEDHLADLVVDASGRGSRSPQWLAALGYGKVEETRVQVDVGYATRIYQPPKHVAPDWKVLIVFPTPGEGKRAGAIFPIEGNRWMVTLFGWSRDYAPDDDSGFLSYARSLPMPDLYDAIKEAQPLSPITTHKYPANQRRHYERLARFPEGLIILGDAACSFDPIYGQGMTVAALEANTLNTCLRQQSSAGLAKRFQKAIAKVLDVPWLLATNEDFRFPETQGQRPRWTGLLHWYTRRLFGLAASNPGTTLRSYEVLNMVKPPTALFGPRLLLAVLFKKQPASARHETTSIQGERVLTSSSNPAK